MTKMDLTVKNLSKQFMDFKLDNSKRKIIRRIALP